MADLLFYALVFLIALLAALIDVIVGGANLITVPALMILGVSPLTTIGTIRIYVTVFVLTGFLNYLHKKVPLNWKILVEMILARSLGAFIGSNIVLSVPVQYIRYAVAGLMIMAMVSILVLNRRQHKAQHASAVHHSPSKLILILSLMLLLGLYEGFVGGGSGTISRALLVLFLGYAMLEAALAELLISFFSSLTASAVFIANGQVDFILLIPMAAGGIIGALLGSSLAVKKGEEWVRNIFFLVVLLLIMRMAFF